MAEKDGKIVRREVPTNIMYVDHLIRQRRLAEGSIESLYRPIFLRQYLLGGRRGSVGRPRIVGNQAVAWRPHGKFTARYLRIRQWTHLYG